MHRKTLFALTAVLGIVSLNLPAVGQDKPKAPVDPRQASYFVAAGKTYNMHAHDHARMLGKYAAASTKKAVPKAVVQEHTAAIKANVAKAKTAYSKLASSAKKNPDVAKQLAEIQNHLAKVTAQLASLEKASSTDTVESKLLVEQSSAISQELKATHDASKKIDAALIQSAEQTAQNDNFDNSQSSDYYFTGEGHFVD